ncbi:hypothetical protein BH10PSE2_BH10PSE2_09150 [soil metagenome]
MLKKTMIIAAAIASTMAAMPMAASAQSWGHGGHDGRYQHDNRRDYREDRRDYRNDRRDYRYDNRYRDDRRGYNQSRYYRGGTLPYQYRSNWYIRDYNRYGYGPPPRGYGYYRTDTGDIVIAALATGLILSLLNN